MTRLFWLRLYFLFVLAQALLVGCSVVQPAWITVVLPWPASPLNARFIATFYLIGAITTLEWGAHLCTREPGDVAADHRRITLACRSVWRRVSNLDLVCDLHNWSVWF